MRTAIVWFRRDLRTRDNPALSAAARAERTVPVFCFESGLLGGRHASPNRNAYLLSSLRELNRRLRGLGSPLHLRSGPAPRALAELAQESGARELHLNLDHSADARLRELRLREALEGLDCEVIGHSGTSCAADLPGIRTKTGRPYRVFTPFSRAWERGARRQPEEGPRRLTPVKGLRIGRPPAQATVGVDARAKRLAAAAGAGEGASRKLMSAAIASSDSYHELRDDPGADGTSRLSPALHFGTISPLELELALIGRGTPGAAALRRQLAWRDFWMHVIHFNPENRSRELDPRLRGMRWRRDPESLAAWREGRTGVPWIDAGMRQLLAEGWMHNRVRMAVASYLTKNLLLDWRLGESHFMAHLLDGDQAQNNGNWQWAASVGADAQPYFRVFNPVRQQQRFDPRGVYVRRWVPELAAFPDRYLASPWTASEGVQRSAGCLIGRDYPDPLVDLAESRAEAIARFGDQRAR